MPLQQVERDRLTRLGGRIELTGMDTMPKEIVNDAIDRAAMLTY